MAVMQLAGAGGTAEAPWWAWAALGGTVLLSLAIDLVVHRGPPHPEERKRAIFWSLFWVGVGLAFNAGVAWAFGAEAGGEFLSAYLLEQSLSVDNLLVFMLVFRSLQVPAESQRRVLSWGIFGAILMRGVFIGLGVEVLHTWHFVLKLFGVFLVWAAVKLLRGGGDEDEDAGESSTGKLLKWLEARLPWTPTLSGEHFFVVEAGRRVATPLFVALIAVEVSDVIFAVDSIPAAFAVTQEPFLLYGSNILAVLGLRALFIVLSGALAGLRYLPYGLAVVLLFIGVKMLADDYVHLPSSVSLAVIVVALGASVAASLLGPKPS
jgi:tellurite resistance protein TerC